MVLGDSTMQMNTGLSGKFNKAINITHRFHKSVVLNICKCGAVELRRGCIEKVTYKKRDSSIEFAAARQLVLQGYYLGCLLLQKILQLRKIRLG